VQPQLSESVASALKRIKDILTQSKHHALKAINVAMVRAYWEVGREIVEEEQRGIFKAKYGEALISELSVVLSAEFGRGFTPTNLRYMRQFYLRFPIHHALRDELTWTHYRLLSRIENDAARSFYVEESVRAHWSTRDLERQLNSLLFERLSKSRDKAGVLRLANEGSLASQPEDLLRDPFVLEFTGLPERGIWQESNLESALMDRLQAFLLELGHDFFFVARQRRITLEGDHFFVDLVFYHRSLRCFVLIDLKVGKLTHADIGQMLLYTGFFKRETRGDENPPIGLILCTDKNDAVVKYMLEDNQHNVFAARYQMHLPSEETLRAELIRERDALISSGFTPIEESNEG
jgi:predicted nuclease of restriction endonuclease-like (RecB) superfamily